MFPWRRGNQRGCCVVIPIGCLMSLLLVMLVAGVAVAKLL